MIYVVRRTLPLARIGVIPKRGPLLPTIRPFTTYLPCHEETSRFWKEEQGRIDTMVQYTWWPLKFWGLPATHAALGEVVSPSDSRTY